MWAFVGGLLGMAWCVFFASIEGWDPIWYTLVTLNGGLVVLGLVLVARGE